MLNIPSIHYNANFNLIFSLIADDRKHDALKDCEIMKSYTGFTDIIIPCLYEKLDYAFPDSKFILTIRDGFSWIKSVYNHTGGEWFSLFEYMFYGFWKYDERRCLDRYIEYNAGVIEYFKNRNNDLLIIDLADNDKFEKLCNFLNLECPDNIEYPHLNKALRNIYETT